MATSTPTYLNGFMNMKTTTLAALLILPFLSLSAQDLTGTWHGVLDVQGTRLRIVFNIEQSDSGYITTLDSPDQRALGIPVAATTFAPPELRLGMPALNAEYRGSLSGDSITGVWTQALTTLPLVLSKGAAPTLERNRPQEPQRPYPYLDEEVVILNRHDDLRLAGTLTLPSTGGPHPAVVLISGSGPQNRDEEVFGHKPFLVLADHLTRHGIAVLRYDDRGTGASTGNFGSATSNHFATDALSAVEYLKTRPEIDSDNIGLIGHSEGGLVAPMVANRSGDVAYIVLLAGIGIPGSEVSLMQSRTLRQYAVPDEEAFERFTRQAIEIATSSRELSAKRAELTRHYESIEAVLESMLPEGIDVDGFIAQQVMAMTAPWEQFFLAYDPAVDLSKVKVPVLSLNGSNDVQVPAGVNQDGIRKALDSGGNRNVLIRELPGLNHMFQESETGAMSEYQWIEETISPVALEAITRWIAERSK